MTPNIGQQVKLFLRYGIIIEGIVKEWSNDQIIIHTKEDYSVIYNPSEDLIATTMVGKPKVEDDFASIFAASVAAASSTESTIDVFEEESRLKSLVKTGDDAMLASTYVRTVFKNREQNKNPKPNDAGQKIKSPKIDLPAATTYDTKPAKPEPLKIAEQKKTELDRQFVGAYEEPSNDPKGLRIQKLAKLRQMMKVADREIVVNRLKDHTAILDVRPVYGSQIDIFKKQ